MWQQHLPALAAFLRGSTTQLIAELDPEGRLVDANAGLLALLGPEATPVGESFFSLFETESGSAPRPRLAPGPVVVRTRPPSPPARLEAELIRSGEALLLVAVRVTPELRVVEELAKLNDEMTNLVRELHKEKAALARSLARIRHLEGLISICSYCHRMRDESQSWQRLDKYLTEHSDASFSHGICPGCLAEHFGPDSGS